MSRASLSLRDLFNSALTDNLDGTFTLKTSATLTGTTTFVKHQTSQDLSLGILDWTVPELDNATLMSVTIHSSAALTESAVFYVTDTTDANYTTKILTQPFVGTSNFMWSDNGGIVPVLGASNQRLRITLTNAGLSGTVYITVIYQK